MDSKAFSSKSPRDFFKQWPKQIPTRVDDWYKVGRLYMEALSMAETRGNATQVERDLIKAIKVLGERMRVFGVESIPCIPIVSKKRDSLNVWIPNIIPMSVMHSIISALNGGDTDSDQYRFALTRLKSQQLSEQMLQSVLVFAIEPFSREELMKIWSLVDLSDMMDPMRVWNRMNMHIKKWLESNVVEMDGIVPIEIERVDPVASLPKEMDSSASLPKMDSVDSVLELSSTVEQEDAITVESSLKTLQEESKSAEVQNPVQSMGAGFVLPRSTVQGVRGLGMIFPQMALAQAAQPKNSSIPLFQESKPFEGAIVKMPPVEEQFFVTPKRGSIGRRVTMVKIPMPPLGDCFFLTMADAMMKMRQVLKRNERVDRLMSLEAMQAKQLADVPSSSHDAIAQRMRRDVWEYLKQSEWIENGIVDGLVAKMESDVTSKELDAFAKIARTTSVEEAYDILWELIGKKTYWANIVMIRALAQCYLINVCIYHEEMDEWVIVMSNKSKYAWESLPVALFFYKGEHYDGLKIVRPSTFEWFSSLSPLQQILQRSFIYQ